MTERQKQQIDLLVSDTIRGGLYEDLKYASQKEADEVCAYLKERVESITPYVCDF